MSHGHAPRTTHHASRFPFLVAQVPSCFAPMSLLPFEKLPGYAPRRFLPETIDLGHWPQIAPLFDQLEARASQCGSPEELEGWLLDWSELSAALDEESSKRYIAMTCHTEDLEAEKAY